jgi:hypothetical protein
MIHAQLFVQFDIHLTGLAWIFSNDLLSCKRLYLAYMPGPMVVCGNGFLPNYLDMVEQNGCRSHQASDFNEWPVSRASAVPQPGR